MKQRIVESGGDAEASQVNQGVSSCSGLAPRTGPSDAVGDVSRSEDANLVSTPADAPSRQSQKFPLSKKKRLLNWFRRALLPDPAEPRNSPRESLSWLIAYFFTGGTPAAHLVRDVSCTGMYVFTEERWYLGTIIRITMTDRRQATPERSLTLNARVVRCGHDGVGLQFLLPDGKDLDSSLVPALGESLNPVGKPQLEDFLARLKITTN